MKELIENIIDMHRAGFSMEAISETLGCSIEMVEKALELIDDN
jgi:uncharacterized protein (DUF433 family)